ncbi:hypothetical protein AAA799P11_00310 [Marine Group I thaumarchaeote SCGC AAA799-P11]|uniref:Uncharacterized protein n=1 Tax=Marine Group I thaumarchaeote SCGC AAA799-P11 TaxID=1502295 RepID=A0A087S2Q2_9ARCH|nr:hypothetical protein AAA799P11_00310 [Marine Group I thaumarchaeote SCGC AAA799-P11]
MSSELLIEKLLEQRDSYLHILKHLEFSLSLDPSIDEKPNIEKLQTKTIEQLKKIEQEIAHILSKDIR